MDWEAWIVQNKDNLKHVAGFEEQFVRSVLTRIEDIEPQDVETQYHFKDSQGGNRYIDFMIINEAKGFLLPIELDGIWKVQSYHEFDDMLNRQNALLREYGVLLRYTNKLMLNNPSKIIDEISYTLSLQSKNQLTKAIVDKQTAQRIENYQKELELIKQQQSEQAIRDKKNKQDPGTVLTKDDLATLQATISSLRDQVEEASQTAKAQTPLSNQSTAPHSPPPLPQSTAQHVPPPLPTPTSHPIDSIQHTIEPKNTRFQLKHVIGLGIGCFAMTAYGANLYFKPKDTVVAVDKVVNLPKVIAKTPKKEQIEKISNSSSKPENIKKNISDESKNYQVTKKNTSSSTTNEEKIKSISASQARSYIGSYQVVCGDIAQVKKFSKGTYLNFGSSYPKQDATIVIWDTDRSNFGNLDQYKGSNLCVEGKIGTYKGTPQIKLVSANKLK
jgi:very-short-patch-repair endonuclease